MTKRITLTNTMSLGIENYDSRARLIVFEHNEEVVCRKESLSALNKFLEEKSAEIFKGRLRMIKNDDAISVMVKGDIVGQISHKDLKDYIAELSMR